MTISIVQDEHRHADRVRLSPSAGTAEARLLAVACRWCCSGAAAAAARTRESCQRDQDM